MSPDLMCIMFQFINMIANRNIANLCTRRDGPRITPKVNRRVLGCTMLRRLISTAFRSRIYFYAPVKAAILLAGCGPLDGTDPMETAPIISTMEKKYVNMTFFSLDKPSFEVLDHDGMVDTSASERNLIAESGRICRDTVYDLADLEVDEFDLLVVPGGGGVLSNLSTSGFSNDESFEVEPIVIDVVEEFHRSGKPISGTSSAGLLFAKILPGVNVTVGDEGASGACRIGASLGAMIDIVQPWETVIDPHFLCVTAPGKGSNLSSPRSVAEGSRQMVKGVVKMARRARAGKRKKYQRRRFEPGGNVR